LLSGLLLSSFIFLPAVAASNDSPPTGSTRSTTSKSPKSKYTPPRRRRRPPKVDSTVGGSRGCPGEENNISAVLLAPNTFVGKTTSVNPTLSWFTSKPDEMDLRLYEFGIDDKIKPVKIGEKDNISEIGGGIYKFKLPQSKVLEKNKQYLWRVSVKCNDGSYSMQKAEFEVIQKPQKLQTELSNVKDSSQKAQIYAANELWYEAFEESLKVSDRSQLGKENLAPIKNLISVYKEELQNEKNNNKKQNIQKQIRYLETVLSDKVIVNN
jgi:hypothetical protein